MSEGLRYVLELHRGGHTGELLTFYGAAAAFVLVVVILVLLADGRRKAGRAIRAVGEVEEMMRNAFDRLDGLARQLEQRLDTRAKDLEARMTGKVDHRCDLIETRGEERGAGFSDALNRLESRLGKCGEDIERFRERVDEVERRIPGLFDRLEELRNALARSFQVELSGVLSSFDNSVTAILHQMKSELQVGVGRIEGIENMVRSRQRAQRSLLGATTSDELPEEFGGEEEFEEWEAEAKELARDEEEGEGLEEAAPERPAEAPAPEPEEEPGTAFVDEEEPEAEPERKPEPETEPELEPEPESDERPPDEEVELDEDDLL